jgi:hypothetical protein
MARVHRVPPPQIELRLEQSFDRFARPGFRQLHPVDITLVGEDHAFWQVVAPDSVILTWTSGFVYVQVRAMLQDRHLIGIATTASDQLTGAIAYADFSADPVTCGSGETISRRQR